MEAVLGDNEYDREGKYKFFNQLPQDDTRFWIKLLCINSTKPITVTDFD